MKKFFSVILLVGMILSFVIPAPVQAEPYEGYPFVFEDFEDGNCTKFTVNGGQFAYEEGGVGGSLGAMKVKLTGKEYCDVNYVCTTPPATGGKIRFSAWVKLLDELSADKISFILYGKVNAKKTDETVDGPDVKQVTGGYQVMVSNKGLKVGEWVKITHEANWSGALGCNPGVGYEGVTEETKNIPVYLTDIVHMDRFSIRVGSLGGTKDLVDQEGTSVNYIIDDITYEFAPAETEDMSGGKNIVKNGEFDENTVDWMMGGTNEIVQDGTAPDGSKGYLKVSTMGSEAKTMDIEQRMTWRANHVYHVSYWSKIFETTENTTEGGSWLLQIAGERVVDENGLNDAYPGVDMGKTLTVGGDWVKTDYYFINEYKTYTERDLRTWLRIFPQTKQHVPYNITVGLDAFKIIDLGPISNGDMEIGSVDNLYKTSTSKKNTQDVLGWNTNGVTTQQSDDVSVDSEGAKSMKVTVDSDGGYAYKGISLNKGKKYQLTFRAKGENLENEVPFTMVLDRKVEAEGSNDIYTVPDYEYYTGKNEVSDEYTNMDTQEWKLSNEWKTYTCTISNDFPLKEGKAEASFIFPRLPFMYFIVDGDNKAGTTYYIDDIAIEELPEDNTPIPKITNAKIVGDLIPGNEVYVDYKFSNSGEGTDKTFVRMLVETDNGEYASLAAFGGQEGVIVPESVAGKKVVFEIVPMDSEYNYGKYVYIEAEDPGEWTKMYYDRKTETAKIYSASDKVGDLAVAAYKNGQLISVEIKPIDAKANEKTEVAMDRTESEKADVIKVMLLDSVVSMEPLVKEEVVDCSVPVETNIYLLGDSVCADYGASSYWQQGWGQHFPNVVKDNLFVYNRGVGGRSSKTFIQEGRWESVKAELKPGDYIIVNFGLNDIHSSVVTETSDGRGTTIEDYKMYLKQYGEEAIALGVTPIYISTIAEMSGSYIYLQKRAIAMREVADELGAAFIDLNTYMNNLLMFDENGEPDEEKRQASFDEYYLSTVAFEKIEKEFNCTVPQSTLDYVAKTPDRTHINYYGAKLVAESMAQLIKESDSYLKNYMK